MRYWALFFLMTTVPCGSVLAQLDDNRTEPGAKRTVIDRLWWNQPTKIEKLQLTVEQRARMDDRAREYFVRQVALKRDQKAALAQLGRGLSTGDTAIIDEARSALIQATSEPVENQVRMMTDIFAILTDAQTDTFTSNYPGMPSRLWIRSASPTSLLRKK